VLRRRRIPEHLREAYEAFDTLVPPLERAKVALTESVPGTRLPGRPLAETLLEFEDGLREVAAGMDGWRVPQVEEVWLLASSGLDDARRLAQRIRVEAPDPGGFEGLIGLIGDLLAPLEAFAHAEDRFRGLRR
jgi:hypothetical protein